jgi:hypothetical protein
MLDRGYVIPGVGIPFKGTLDLIGRFDQGIIRPGQAVSLHLNLHFEFALRFELALALQLALELALKLALAF